MGLLLYRLSYFYDGYLDEGKNKPLDGNDGTCFALV